MTPLDHIRCLSIIAHIDHGKSTLADRLLELTGAVDPRDMRAQYLDSMDLERERGITIKAQNVRLEHKGYVVNLIDTPGHVDFGYEVSRSLAACEGVILLVDASQGIEAQTLANAYQAVEHDLTIVAALNKIDLPGRRARHARPARSSACSASPADEVLRISAKTGEGVAELLDAVIERIPPPKGDADAPTQALIFDSYYDPYRGVVSAVRVFNGTLRSGARLRYVQARQDHDAEEIGVRLPVPTPVAALGPGEVGYLIAGIKEVGAGEGRRDRHRRRAPGRGRSPGTANRSRWCSAASTRSTATSTPTCATRSRSCGSTTRRSPTNRRRRARSASGSGAASSGCCTWRSCASGSSASTTSRSSRPRRTSSTRCELTERRGRDRRQPVVDAAAERGRGDRGAVRQRHRAHPDRVRRHAHGAVAAAARRAAEDGVPLGGPRRARLPAAARPRSCIDFFDQLKSRTRGYASLDYEPAGYRASNLVKVDVLLNNTPVDAFSAIVHRDKAYDYGRKMTQKLRELIPRQLFDVPIQAAVGGRIVARETVKAKRKDVLAKCYGGDITRKRKLLERQKEGKRRMKQIGRVEVPQEAFVAALRLDD